MVRAFAKSLKPPIRLSLAALETLAVIAYKQPVTGPEIADIRGVESASVLGTLLDRKLITTAGRKQVIGRPMQYKTSKDFLLRFGLNDVNELPSMEEFSQLASDGTIEIAPPSAASSIALRARATPAGPEPQRSEAAPDSEPSQRSWKSETQQVTDSRAATESDQPSRSGRQPAAVQKLSPAMYPKPSTPSASRSIRESSQGRRCPCHFLRVTFFDRLMASGFSERLYLPWKQNLKDYRRFWPRQDWPRGARPRS